jgi:3'-5' exoribonuclease
MFPEALVLHYMDDLDSKLESMRAMFEREADSESAWTSYNPSLGRPLLNTQKLLRKQPEPAAEQAPKHEATPSAVAAAAGKPEAE